LAYIFSSLGMYWGRLLTQKYQNALCNAASVGTEKVINLCAKVGLISSETAEMFKAAKDEFNDGLEETVGMFKELFKQVFVPGSSIRAMVIPILERRGDIENRDTIDSLAVTKEVLHTILIALAHPGLMSYLDVEIIQQTFAQDPTKIDMIINHIIAAVRANLIAMCGGYIGAYAASWIGCGIMWNHGPFFVSQSQPA
jgi:hypothetical protein